MRSRETVTQGQFQNRRRAVKVEQQSAAQRAEAEARGQMGLAPPYVHEQVESSHASPTMSGAGEVRPGVAQMPRLPMPHGQYRQVAPHGARAGTLEAQHVVKREMSSPERSS